MRGIEQCDYISEGSAAHSYAHSSFLYACVAQLVVQRNRNELVAAKKSAGCTSDVEISIN